MGLHHLARILFCIGIVVIIVTIALVFILEVHFGMGVIGIVCTVAGIYIAMPVIFYFWRALQRQMVFMNLFYWSPGNLFYEPETHGLEGGRNFYLHPDPSIKIGIWHILPKSEVQRSIGLDASHWEITLRESGRPIIIYFHGSMGTRGTTHRIELYKVFQREDCHVITFDYRGFADSLGSPSETGVVADGFCIYSWLRNIVGQHSKVPIYFWGHSLGTGVSTHLVANLCRNSNTLGMLPPTGIFLEAPFTSMPAASRTTIFSAIFRPIPGAAWLIATALKRSDLTFESERHIEHVSIPVTILHNTRDVVVRYCLGNELRDIGNQLRSKSSKPIYLHEFRGGSFSSAHVHICREPELGSIIQNFIEMSTEAASSFKPSLIISSIGISLLGLGMKMKRNA